MNSPRTLLVCEDGRVYTGETYGATGSAIGSLSASTAMTGYQEALTSGAYEGSILLFTSPHIGNTGVNDEDGVNPVRARGVVFRERPRTPSNWRATRALEADLLAAGTVGIVGVDTRALMRALRETGSMKVGIFTEETRPVAELLQQVKSYSQNSDSLVSGITAEAASRVGEGVEVGVIDLGLGRELSGALVAKGAGVTIFPATVTASEVLASGVTRVVFSGGPGNPADQTIGLGLARELLETPIPILGIGLGHQILARALGYATAALDHAHHGVNHPVQNLKTGKVDITSHSHNYTVDFAGSPEVEITHVSLNDGSVEGFTLKDRAVSGFQFHAFGPSGPTDAHHLLTSFLSKEA